MRLPINVALDMTDGCRCMALSVAIFVGTAREWIPELIERAKNLKVTGGFEEGADLYVALPFSSSSLSSSQGIDLMPQWTRHLPSGERKDRITHRISQD